MGSGIYVNGQKYVSSKDACTISGYTSDQIEILCSKGELRSKRFGGVCFIEKRSLIECLNEFSCFDNDQENVQQEKIEINRYLTWRGYKDNSISSDIYQNRDERQPSFSIINGFVAVTTVAFIFILFTTCGKYFSGSIQGLKINIADVPSSYNSTRFINNDNGMVAAVGKMNDTATDGIGIVSSTIYDGMIIIFTCAHDLILKMYGTAMREENKTELQLLEEKNTEVHTSQAATHSGIEGIVITPSKNKYDDADTIEQIKNSFSDDVKIIPDEGGGSGIIQPVFRNSDGDEYIYVLVPIQKDEK